MSDFKAKMHQIRFRLGLCPRPRWGSLQRSPDPLAGLKGPTSKGRGGRGREGWAREGSVREGREGEGKFAPAPSKYIWIDAAGDSQYCLSAQGEEKQTWPRQLQLQLLKPDVFCNQLHI